MAHSKHVCLLVYQVALLFIIQNCMYVSHRPIYIDVALNVTWMPVHLSIHIAWIAQWRF